MKLNKKLQSLYVERNNINNQIFNIKSQGITNRLTNIANSVLTRNAYIVVNDLIIDYDEHNNYCQIMNITIKYRGKKYYFDLQCVNNNEHSITFNKGKIINSEQMRKYICNKYRLPSGKLLKMLCILLLENLLLFENDDYDNTNDVEYYQIIKNN